MCDRVVVGHVGYVWRVVDPTRGTREIEWSAE